MHKKIASSILILITFVFLGIICFAAPPSNDYVLVLEDEFEGTELNTDIWDYRSGAPYGGRNLKENVRIENGKLALDYRKVGDEYTGAGVLTKSPLSYGYYEVKAKVYSGANGLHTSFWTSGADAFKTKPENLPYNNCLLEIDIFEINSREDNRFCTISYGTHYWYDYHIKPHREYDYDTDTSGEYFVMGLEWLPDKTSFFVNGKLIGSFDALPTYGLSYLWLTAVAMPDSYDNGDGTFNIDDSKMDENGYFGSSYFEYFKYYQKPIKNENLLTNPNFEYDRISTDFFPTGYILKGDKTASGMHKSTLSNDGYIYHFHHGEKPYSLSTGQELAFLLPGKYTFKGAFCAEGEFDYAKISVYDKEGNIIATSDIPKNSEWTEVSLSDIQIDGYAYVAVESKSNGGTMLKIDSLEFFNQAGEEYSTSITPLYEKELEEISPNTYYYNLNDATSYNGVWLHSSMEKNSYYLGGKEKNVEVVWEIPIYETDTYIIDLRNLIDSGNTPVQYYYITTPDGKETEITVDTLSGETRWENLANIPLNKGDTLKIAMRSNKQRGTVRAGILRLTRYSDKIVNDSTTMQINQCIFTHNNLPMIFDRNNRALTPYEENNTIYIPYQALKSIYPQLTGDKEYATLNQLENEGIGVDISLPTIILHDKNETITDYIRNTSLDTLFSFLSPLIYKTPMYIGTEKAENEIRYTHNDAVFHGGQWTKSSHILQHQYAKPKTHFATYQIDAEKSGLYALEIFCPSHQNSETDAYISVSTNKESKNYMLDQTGTYGWYSLGFFDLEKDETIRIKLTKNDDFGLLRAADIRLVPLNDNPEVLIDNDMVTINLGHAHYYIDSVLVEELEEERSSYKIISPVTSETSFRLNKSNALFTLFFWRDLKSLQPLLPQYYN